VCSSDLVDSNEAGIIAVRTPTVLRTNANSLIASGAYAISFANVGTANATIGSGFTTLKPGEIINFDAGGINNVLNSIAYNGTGTELLIIILS
jgi:hypothetical protein